MKVVSYSGLIPGTGSEVMAVRKGRLLPLNRLRNPSGFLPSVLLGLVQLFGS